MSRVIKFRALYEGEWYYQTLEEVITITLAAFRLGAHKTQFTGLTDKNGTEIYEGDLLESHFIENYIVPVIWDEVHAQFTFGAAEFNVEARPDELEIKGNIYQNPELLNQQP